MLRITAAESAIFILPNIFIISWLSFEFSPIPSFTTNASAPSPGVFEDNPRDKRATHQSLIGGQIITFAQFG
jgi:hypothetical protein